MYTRELSPGDVIIHRTYTSMILLLVHASQERLIFLDELGKFIPWLSPDIIVNENWKIF